jgi:prolyl-tRNA synthetase
MFADWELLGIPQRVVISERALKDGVLEVQGRRESEAHKVPLAEVRAFVKAQLAS